MNNSFGFVKIFLIINFLIFLSCANTHDLSKNKQPSVKAKYIFVDKNTDLYGLLDENGKEVLGPKYKYIGWMKDGLMPAFTVDEEFVIIRENGFPVKDVKFWDISFSYTEDLLGVADVETKKWGFVDRNLNYVIKPQFEQVGTFIDGITVAKNNNLFGVINKKGEFIIDPVFSEIKGYGKGTLVGSKNGKIKVVNVFTKTASEFEYDDFYGMAEEKAVVEKEGSIYLSSGDKTLLLMKKPDGIIYEIYNHAFLSEDRFFLKYSENNNVRHIAVFSISGGKIICDKEGWLDIEKSEHNKEIFKVKTSNNEEKWIDKNCAEKESPTVLQQDKKNEHEKSINKQQYDDIKTSMCEERSVSFKLNGKWGYLNEKGEEIVPAIYDKVEAFYKNRAGVKIDGRSFVIDREGKTIFEIKQNWGFVSELYFVEPICYGWGLYSIISEDYWFSREKIKERLKKSEKTKTDQG
jgi:hypothetical protein